MELNRKGKRMHQKLNLKESLQEKRDYDTAQAKGEENKKRKAAHLERVRRRPLRKAGKLYNK